jgi:hypothetical protein
MAGHTLLQNGTAKFENNVWYDLQLELQGSIITGYFFIAFF